MSENQKQKRWGSICCILAVVYFSMPPKKTQANLSLLQDSSFTVVLFEYHVPGAYRFLQIDESGMCEFVQFQRNIQQYRLGYLSSNVLDSLMLYFSSKSFNQLEDKYDVYPIDPTLPPMVYEDTYYLLNVTRAGQSKKVLAHEHAAPKILKQMLSTLFSIGRKLPDQTQDGLFLLVNEPEIASKIRWLKSAEGLVVEFNNETLSLYPALKEAVLKPGWLYSIPSLEAVGIQKFFAGSATRFELIYRGKKLVACVLKHEKNKEK